MTRCIAFVIIAMAFATGQTDTTFSYQGELMDNGSLANGSYNLDFVLWDALNAGTQIGSTIMLNAVPVTDGRFVELPGERIGMIAQEVERVVPDWVDVRDDGYKTVTHRGFEALTVKALRELRAEKDAQIESQAKRVAKIERENTKLRVENDRLAARLDSLEQLVEQLTTN